jgi:hypothetical protein
VGRLVNLQADWKIGTKNGGLTTRRRMASCPTWEQMQHWWGQTIMRLILVIGALLLPVSCHQPDRLDLHAPKPAGLPVFAGDWSSGGRLLHMERPRYPADLRYLGDQTVRLKCTILADGSVSEITLQNGPRQLLSVARAAVARWRYEPVRIYNPMTGRSTPQAIITEIHLRFER